MNAKRWARWIVPAKWNARVCVLAILAATLAAAAWGQINPSPWQRGYSLGLAGYGWLWWDDAVERRDFEDAELFAGWERGNTEFRSMVDRELLRIESRTNQ